MQPADRIRRFRLRRGRRRGLRVVVPGPSPTGRPWRQARLTWEYRQRYDAWDAVAKELGEGPEVSGHA